MNKHVIVGMSGGVDSSVTALKLISEGYRVSGLFMKNWEEDDDNGQCTAVADLADAQQVCETLGIPLKTVNFSAEYWDYVFEHFLEEHRAGRTPNPDVLCNKHIKFKAFLDFALDLGADCIATGHYARINSSGNAYQLLKGLDGSKDQSYFLYTLGQSALSKCTFPLGDLQKQEVRQLASQAGFKNSRKKDSTGICFIGERKFRTFLNRFLPSQPGEIRTAENQVIGEHHGLMYYTLGQRRGLGIGGVQGTSEEPWYVLGKDLKNNVLIAGQGHHHPMLYNNSLEAIQLDWVSGRAPETEFRCQAKIRYRQADQECLIQRTGKDRYRVIFDSPQRAISPGQSIVFYRRDCCLGGGVIDSFSRIETAISTSAIN
jgi:tRNA-specific 2-thiouridylase